jgi:hypothetical protein
MEEEAAGMGARGGGTGMGAMGGCTGTGSGAMGGVGAGGCGLGFSMGESSREAGFRVRVFEAGSSAVVAMETEAARNPCGKENDGWRRQRSSRLFSLPVKTFVCTNKYSENHPRFRTHFLKIS